MGNLGTIIILAIIVFAVIIFIRCFRIVPQAHVFVIERLGSFKTEWETGFHVLVPFIDRIASRVSLKEKVVDFNFSSVFTNASFNFTKYSAIYFNFKSSIIIFYSAYNAHFRNGTYRS